MASSRGGGSQQVIRTGDLEKMSLDQLKGVKEQADIEVNLLQDSLNNIRTATGRLENASAALHDLSLRPQGPSTIPSPINHLLHFLLLVIKYLNCHIYIDYFWVLGKKMLVPLTASLYVPGTLDDADKVLVDIGTGYFVEVYI